MIRRALKALALAALAVLALVVGTALYMPAPPSAPYVETAADRAADQRAALRAQEADLAATVAEMDRRADSRRK